MKLLEALQIANAPQQGDPFRALLVTGFSPLHLETALKAHLRLALAGRTVTIQTGVFGDIAAGLEKADAGSNAIFVALEWADLDPRLGWRTMAKSGEEIVGDARARLDRISAAIAAAARVAQVVLSLPTLPLPPIFHTCSGELNRIEGGLRRMVYELAASTRATVLHPESLRAGSSHDLRTDLLNGFPYPFAHADALAAGLAWLALPVVPKKGLVTDLDETLWGGVLGDDGPEGISWDLEHHTQFHGLYQELLNLLSDSGVLLGVASKNDAALVEKAFTRRDLAVRPSQFFPVEAHWASKVESLRRILLAWNIAPDAVVFVDDNPLELEQVKSAYPTMECIQFREDDARFLTGLRDRFAKREIREEDRLRVESLRTGGAVLQAAGNPASLDALLAGAEARIVVRWGKQPPDARALELINKTNQFNLNGERFDEADWNAYLADSSTHLALVEYEDRFGKLGRIAVLAGREREGRFDLDIWVMSCRAFSRRIEYQCLKVLLGRWETVRLRFVPTERNGPIRQFIGEVAPELAVRRDEFDSRCPPLYHQTESDYGQYSTTG